MDAKVNRRFSLFLSGISCKWGLFPCAGCTWYNIMWSYIKFNLWPRDRGCYCEDLQKCKYFPQEAKSFWVENLLHKPLYLVVLMHGEQAKLCLQRANLPGAHVTPDGARYFPQFLTSLIKKSMCTCSFTTITQIPCYFIHLHSWSLCTSRMRDSQLTQREFKQ